jgi:transcriptional regulator with PAS, ATPase and Fis domain
LSQHKTQTLDDRRAGDRSDSREAFLHLIIGAHDLDLLPRRYALDDIDRVALGRGDEPANRRKSEIDTELRVEIPDGVMSAEHAILLRSAAGWIIRDVGSKNGVFVDGVRVQTSEVKEGSIIELGRSFFTMSRHAADPVDQLGSVLADDGIATVLPSLEVQFKHALQVARSEVPVVITGETGTGKELVTRAIHKASARSGPCVTVNCGALAPNLVESELFGYRRGAFSGALEDRPGLIRSAHKGTLFLDEIGELPAPVQVTLLRALEQKAVIPVGGTTEIPVDFRLCSATHRDLRRAVSAGTFRADLFARIAGFSVELPPLRKRREDLGIIVAAIARRFRAYAEKISFTNDAVRAILTYEWPQNIRELAKAIETALILAQGSAIDVAHLTSLAAPAPTPVREDAPPENDETLRQRLLAALERHHGNLSAIAREFEKDRVQIRRWIQRFQIDLSGYRDADS